MATPVDFLTYHMKVFKYYGILDIESIQNSQILKYLMLIHAIGTQIVFVDIGCILFMIPLLDSPPAKEALRIIFTVVAYVNAVVKGKIFILNRTKFQDLWSRLNDREFLAVNPAERE